jgi:hypothetical protein
MKQNRNREIMIAKMCDDSSTDEIYINRLRSVVRNINNKIYDSNKDI